MAITQTRSEITFKDHTDHFLARWGFRREGHLITPGLYALGKPGKESPVFVTANYTLSFDALRSALAGVDGYILVLDTRGINVWCAAGKGTFGTAELIRRIGAAGLADVVSHKKLILPQLGAPGVNAFEVTRRTGFKVEYGPVRAQDIPEYLRTGQVTASMRQVDFPLRDRIVLIPVELVAAFVKVALLTIGGFLAGGWLAALAIVAAALTGIALFPVLMPYIPTKDYSTRGLLLGLIVAIPFAAGELLIGASPDWAAYVSAFALLAGMPAISAYLALNFTGSTPYPSRTGVRKEIYTYIPVMAVMFALGALLMAAMAVAQFTGVI